MRLGYAVFLIVAAMWGSDAIAKERRHPVPRVTELRLDEGHRVREVARLRTPGKSYAAFSAEPRPLEKGERVVFTIHSVGRDGRVPRWRCVAKADVAECLGKQVKVSYLPGDVRVVLVAKLEPERNLEN